MACPTPISMPHPHFEDAHHFIPCGVCDTCVRNKARQFAGGAQMHTHEVERDCGPYLSRFCTFTYRDDTRPWTVPAPLQLGTTWKPHPKAKAKLHELYAKHPARAHSKYLRDRGWSKQEVFKLANGKLPPLPTARYSDVQLFMRLVRQACRRRDPNLRPDFAWAIEYTPQNQYPHYHGLVWRVPDDIWHHHVKWWEKRFGFVDPSSDWLDADPSRGQFTAGRAMYVAGYAKKIHRHRWDSWLQGRQAERLEAGRSPPIGRSYCWRVGEEIRQQQFLPAVKRQGLAQALFTFIQSERAHSFRSGKFFYPYTPHLKEALWNTVLQDVEPWVRDDLEHMISEARVYQHDAVTFGYDNLDGVPCDEVDQRQRQKALKEQERSDAKQVEAIARRAHDRAQPRVGPGGDAAPAFTRSTAERPNGGLRSNLDGGCLSVGASEAELPPPANGAINLEGALPYLF